MQPMESAVTAKLVMPGLDPGIHDLTRVAVRKTWMAGHRRAEATPSFGRLRPAMTKPTPPSSLRKQGPITTGLYCCAKAVERRLSKQRPRRMGPCFRRDDELRASTPLSSRRRPGPITTGFGCCAKAVEQRLSTQRPRRMGPGLRRDDSVRTISPPSSPRRRGPITTGLCCCAKAVEQRPSSQPPRRMGPCFRRDDSGVE
jgi:hypothetical protein